MRIDSLSSFNHNKLQYSPKSRVSFVAYYDSTLYGKSIENHGDGVLYKYCELIKLVKFHKHMLASNNTNKLRIKFNILPKPLK